MKYQLVLWRDRFGGNDVLVVPVKKTVNATLRAAVKEAEKLSGEDFDNDREYVELLEVPVGYELVKC